MRDCMDVNAYLRKFLAELHRLRPVPRYHECDHSIGLGEGGELEIRLSAGDIYKVALLSALDPDPVNAAFQAATGQCKFTHSAANQDTVEQPRLETDDYADWLMSQRGTVSRNIDFELTTGQRLTELGDTDPDPDAGRRS